MADHAPTRFRLLAVAGPLVLAAFQLVGTLGASQGQPEATGLDPLAVAIVLAGPLSLLLLRQAPLRVLAFVTVISFVYLARGYPYGPVFAAFVVAVVVNVAIGHRKWGWAALAGVAGSSVLATTVADGGAWSWPKVAGLVAWSLVVAVVGELVRVRRANVVEARRRRAEQARREAGEERLRIARELHDVVAHHMSLINVQAGVALHLVERRPDQVEAALQTIKDASKDALNELRALIGVLRSAGEDAPRSPVATLANLDDLAARTTQAGVALSVDRTGGSADVPSAVDLAAYRIIQEAVTNVVRHSGARSARVRIDVGADVVRVEVTDDGRGLDPRAAVGGSGIRGMQERAAALGGRVTVGEAPTGGVRVRAELPMEASR